MKKASLALLGVAGSVTLLILVTLAFRFGPSSSHENPSGSNASSDPFATPRGGVQPPSLSGLVYRRSTRLPVASVVIELSRHDQVVYKTTTNDDGHYRIDGLELGAYDITTKASYLTHAIGDGGLQVEGKREYRRDIPVAIGPPISGRVTTSNNASLDSIELHCTYGTKGKAFEVIPCALNEVGSFQAFLDGVDDVVTLTARAPGYVPSRSRVLKVDSHPITGLEFTLYVGGKAEGLIVDEALSPVAGARVEFRSIDVAQVPRSYEAHSNREGLFEMSELSEGNYVVHVKADGYVYEQQRDPVTIIGGQVSPFKVFRIRSGWTLAGEVRTSTGAPISGAAIQLTNEGVFYSTVTREGGTFRFTGIFPDPSSASAVSRAIDMLQCKAPGYASEVRRQVPVDQPVILELDTGGMVLIRVALSDGQVEKDFEWLARFEYIEENPIGEGRVPITRVPTGRGSEMLVSDLREGLYNITVVANGRDDFRFRRVQVRSEVTVTLDAVLIPGVTSTSLRMSRVRTRLTTPENYRQELRAIVKQCTEGQRVTLLESLRQLLKRLPEKSKERIMLAEALAEYE